MKKIAMFGGSFNPVHLGHTGLVSRMTELFSFDCVYVIPTFNTPLKDNTPMLLPLHRMNMCKLAFEEYENVIVSDMEIVREGKSYTVDTLKSLSALYTLSDIYLIIGADSFMQLPLWYKAEEIFSIAKILTISRGEFDFSALDKRKSEYEEKFGARVFVVEDPVSPISSTQIRTAINKKEEYKHLLPKKVSDYIELNGLYAYED